MVYEAMIPASDAPLLASGVGTEVTVRSMNRFLDEFLWHAGALAEARLDGTPY